MSPKNGKKTQTDKVLHFTSSDEYFMVYYSKSDPLRLQYTPYDVKYKSDMLLEVFRLRLHYIRLFPDPRFLLFVLQNIAGYKNRVECLLQ